MKEHEGREPSPRPDNLYRLVRLRLALALVAAALGPLVIITVIIPTLLGNGRDQDTQQIQNRSIAASASIAAELQRLRSALLVVAADPSAQDLMAHGSTSAAARVAALLPSLDSELTRARIVGPKGTWATTPAGKLGAARASTPDDTQLLAAAGGPAGRGGNPNAGGAGTQPAAGPAATSIVQHPGSITLIAAVPTRSGSGGQVVGAVAFDVSLDALLARVAATAADGSGAYVEVVDTATGMIVGDSRGPNAHSTTSAVPGLSSLVSGIVDGAGHAWTSLVNDGWAVGVSAIPALAAGDPSWAVVVTRPATPTSTPFGLLGLLGLLTLALAGLGAWMSAQVLRPARDLEASRSELRQQYEVARNEALVDPLTGVGNQRAFTEEFDRQLELSRRHALPLALLLLDLDDFKGVNDREGHPAGDRLLAGFASLLTSTVRTSDRVFRLGGDEFAVLMPATEAEGAEAVGRRILGRSLNVPTGGELASVSFSAGVAAAPEHGLLRAELYAGADAALYWSKRHGRTAVEVFDPARHHVNPTLAGELSGVVLDVIRRRDLRVLFQPVVALDTGAVIGFEALTRPTAASAFPDAGSFFTAAQQSGRILEVDVACLDLVTAAAAAIVPDGCTVSINLSPVTLEAAEFSANRLRRLLDRHGIAPERVVVEITEREPIDDLGRVQANVEALRQLGVRVAADDVGAGNSGLQLLSNVRFDIVKIDISLVRDAAVRRQSLEVMRSLVTISKNWGATVVAEGIETPEQLKVAQSLGIDAGQGYLLGRPAERCDVTPVDLASVVTVQPISKFAAFAIPLAPTA